MSRGLKLLKAQRKLQLLSLLLICALALGYIHHSSYAAGLQTGCITADTTVDSTDLTALENAWNTSSAAANLSGTGTVNIRDLAILLGNWNQSCSTQTGTLGNTTQGSTWTTGLIADDKFVEQFAMPATGNITKLTYYVRGDIASSQVAKALVYADSNGSPGALLGQGTEVSVPGNQAAGWLDFSFATPVAVPSGNVWIGLIRGATGGNIDIATNTTGGVETYANNTYTSGASNPFGTEGGTSTYAISGYATYVTAQGSVSAPTVSLSANPTSISSGSSSTLTWSSTNATSCTASGAWSGSKATSGSTSTGALSSSQTYTLTCTGAGGTNNASATVTVTSGGGGGWNGKNPVGILTGGDAIASQTGLSQYSLISIDNDPTEASQVCGQSNTTRLVYFSSVSVNTGYDTGVPWSEANSNGWLLKDSSGNLLINAGYPSNNIGDPANTGYQQAWISNVESIVKSYGCDGVFIDDAVNDPDTLTNAQPALYPTNSSWQTALNSFFSAVGPALKADGISTYANASGYIPGDPNSDDAVNEDAWWNLIGPNLTGLCVEYFEETSDGNFTPMASTGGQWYDYWGNWDNLVSLAQNDGFGIIANMDEPSGGLSTQMIRYGLGSFLLQWNGNSVSAFTLSPPGGSGLDVNTQGVPGSIGTPTAAETQPQSGVYERTYTNGVVIVNSTNSAVTQGGHSLNGTDAYVGP